MALAIQKKVMGRHSRPKHLRSEMKEKKEDDKKSRKERKEKVKIYYLEIILY